MSEYKDINVSNIPADLLKQAQTIAKKEQRPLAQVIRELLKVWVKENEQLLSK